MGNAAGWRGLGAKLVATAWLWWLALGLWAAILFRLSSDSAPPSGPDFPFKDKLLHCAWFTAGAAAFLVAMLGRGVVAGNRGRFVLSGLVFTGIIGALDEYHQTFTPGRMGNDPWDWLADVTGGFLGALVAVRFLLWARQRH